MVAIDACLIAPAALRILVVDDHSVMRDGLAHRIDTEAGMQVVGCVATGEDAIAAAQRLQPDVIIMDLVLPSLNGVDATRHILLNCPKTVVIVLSACRSLEHVRRSLRAGAHGYVLKSSAVDELTEAVRRSGSGSVYFCREIVALHGESALRALPVRNPIETLSHRERQILLLLIAGLTSALIARRLSLSCKTVETYRSRMMSKLGVGDRTALIRLAKDYELPEV